MFLVLCRTSISVSDFTGYFCCLESQIVLCLLNNYSILASVLIIALLPSDLPRTPLAVTVTHIHTHTTFIIHTRLNLIFFFFLTGGRLLTSTPFPPPLMQEVDCDGREEGSSL